MINVSHENDNSYHHFQLDILCIELGEAKVTYRLVWLWYSLSFICYRIGTACILPSL